MNRERADLTSVAVLQPFSGDDKEVVLYSKLNSELKNFVTYVSNSQCDWVSFTVSSEDKIHLHENPHRFWSSIEGCVVPIL